VVRHAFETRKLAVVDALVLEDGRGSCPLSLVRPRVARPGGNSANRLTKNGAAESAVRAVQRVMPDSACMMPIEQMCQSVNAPLTRKGVLVHGGEGRARSAEKR